VFTPDPEIVLATSAFWLFDDQHRHPPRNARQEVLRPLPNEPPPQV
jgi:hypothetical protein